MVSLSPCITVPYLTYCITMDFIPSMLLLVLVKQASCAQLWNPPPLSQECFEKPADMVFVLDGSSSIWGPDFTKQLNFVWNVTRSFRLGADNIQVGVITFATTVNVEIILGEYNDKDKLQPAIMNITQLKGNTNTDEALRILRTTMLNPSYSRSGIPHIAVVITDGASRYKDKTAREATLCKEEGITVFAIGVGREEHLKEDGVQEELQTIATGPDFIYTVDNYGLLDKLKEDLTNKTCIATTMATTTTTLAPPQLIDGCDSMQVMDVVFAAPDEGGIQDTELTMSFIQAVVNGFHIGSMQIQAGLSPRMCGELDGIRLMDHDEKQALLEAIGDRRLGSTQLSYQFRYLLNQAYTVRVGARPNSRKIAVLVVDNQAGDEGEVSRLAAKAKAEEIAIIIVGVGSHADRQQLMSFAYTPQHAFFVDNFRQLSSLPSLIQHRLCSDVSDPVHPPQMIEGCSGTRPLDILYTAPDESGVRQTELVVSFLQKLTNYFHIGENRVQVGMTPRMCTDLHGFSLSTHDEKQALKAAFSDRQLTSTRLNRQLEYILDYGLSSENGGRGEAASFAFVMVNNMLRDPQQTFDLAADLRAAGVTIIAVGIGPYAEELDLIRVASSDRLFMVEDYDNLDHVMEPILASFCRDSDKGVSVEEYVIRNTAEKSTAHGTLPTC